MVDPVISNAGKAGAELFKEATKSMQNASEQVSKFEELRSKMETQEMAGVKNNSQQGMQVQKSEQTPNVQQIEKTSDIGKAGEIPKITDMGSLDQVVNRIKAGQTRLKDLIKDCTSGKTFSPQELLAVQAEVSAITTEISLCSKVVEQGVSAIKSTMQMQV